jgi:transposase
VLVKWLGCEVGKCHDASFDGDLRILGIDDWSWLKGSQYGTIMVDLERPEVVDVLSDRSAETTAAWLAKHPSVEIVSRDRCGLYARGAKQGAAQARQVADRFHLIQNLRLAIEQQLSRGHRSSSIDVHTKRDDPGDPR